MSEQTAEVHELRPTERVSNEEMGSLISAIGNHEAKAIMLGLMAPATTYTKNDAFRALRDSQDPVSWRVSRSLGMDYMSGSLAPVGLVAKEVLIGESLTTFGFVKTEKGENLGDPLAGLLLDFSLRYDDISLIDLFAFTTSHFSTPDLEKGELKKRAPITRLKLFWALVTSPSPISKAADIAREVGEERSNVVGQHLFKLAEKGIVSYDSVTTKSSYSSFSLNPDYPQDRASEAERTHISMTNFVWETIRQAPARQWTPEEIADIYMKAAKEGRPSFYAKKDLQRVLNNLTKQGYLVRAGLTEDSMSSISIAEDRRDMLIDLLTILDGFQKLDPKLLDYGNTRLKEILSDPKTVSKLLAKAKEHSPYASFIPEEESLKQIYSIVSGKPGITFEEIRDLLSSTQGRLHGKSRIRGMIKKLVNDNRLIILSEDPVRKYAPVTGRNPKSLALQN